jgi:hypothetical protein
MAVDRLGERFGCRFGIFRDHFDCARKPLAAVAAKDGSVAGEFDDATTMGTCEIHGFGIIGKIRRGSNRIRDA